MISGGSISSAPISAVAPLLPDVSGSLAWLPRLPDRPPRRARLRTGQRQVPTALNLDPIPNPAPPVDLTWQPRFPTGPIRLRARRFQPIAHAPVPPILFIGTSWLPILPVHPPRRRLRPPVYAIPFDFTPATIPLITAWQTVTRLLVRSRTRLRQESVWLVDPTTLLNAAPCVELGNEQLTNPILAEETLLNPAFGSETLTLPTLDSEDLC